MQVANYILGTLLGRGARSRVWEGRDVRTGRPVAVKVSDGPCTVDVDLLARISPHRGLIEVWERGELDADEADELGVEHGAAFTAMELAAGGSMASASAAPDWRTLRGVLLTLLDALDHLHAQHVAHLDVKPANVLVVETTRGRRLKLADLDSIRPFGAERPPLGTLELTPAFVPPELRDRRAWAISPQADLFSVGVLGWTLATGKLPLTEWLELSSARELAAHLDPTATAPVGFVGWIHMLTRPDPAARYRSAAAAIEALRGLNDLGPGERRATPFAVPVLLESQVAAVSRHAFDDGMPSTQPFGQTIAPPDPFEGLGFDPVGPPHR